MDESDLSELRALADEMRHVATEMANLRKYGQRNRLILWVIAAVVAAYLVMAVAIGAVAFQARKASREAVSAKRANRLTCEAGNDARAVQRQLWGYILDLPPSAPRTPEQEKQREDFKAYINQAFAPRDCERET